MGYTFDIVDLSLLTIAFFMYKFLSAVVCHSMTLWLWALQRLETPHADDPVCASILREVRSSKTEFETSCDQLFDFQEHGLGI